MSIFSKKKTTESLIKELEEDKQKLEYLLVHVNLLRNSHKIAFNKAHIKEHRFQIMNQLRGLVHEMSEELEKINKNLPKKINFENIKEHEEEISKFNEDYNKLINYIKTENENHKKILDEINKEESFEDKEKNLQIDLEKELKVDDKIIEDLQELNKDIDENLKFLKEYKEDSSQNISKEEYERRLNLLRKWGFPVEQKIELAKFLVLNFKDCETIKNNLEQHYFFVFFRFEIIKCEELIKNKPWIWPFIIEIIKITEDNYFSEFLQKLPEKFFTKEYLDSFLNVFRIKKRNSIYFFYLLFGRDLKNIILEKPWILPYLLDEKVLKDEKLIESLYALKYVNELINKETISDWIYILEKLKNDPRRIYYIFSKKKQDLIIKKPWIWSFIVKTIDERNTNTVSFLNMLLLIEGIIEKGNWVKISNKLIKIEKDCLEYFGNSFYC